MRLLSRLRRSRAPTNGPFDAAAALAEHAARLAAGIARLGEREERVREQESFLRRWLERGAAELDEREAALRRLAGELEEREEELAKREARIAIEELAQRRREEEAAAPAEQPAPAPEPDGYVVYLWTAEGYRLLEREGALPAPGDRVNGGRVLNVGRSPFPGDRRRCAFVEEEA